MSRKKLATKNFVSAIILNLITIVLGFVTQRFFILTLGVRVNGAHSLFSTVINIFAMADMGIGAAVIFHMYKPFADNNYPKIASLVRFYRKVCLAVSGIIIVGGCLILTVLPLIVGDNELPFDIHKIFILHIISAVLSYFMTYKRAILQADQKNYVINIVHVAYVVLLNLAQITTLLLTQSYYIFLTLVVIMKIVENIAINYYIKLKYHFIRSDVKTSLDKKIKQSMIKMIKGSFFHNSAGYLVSSVDSVVISSLFGLVILGVYSNYQMIFLAVSLVISQAFYALTSNVGNLLVEGNLKKTREVVKKVQFLNLTLSILASSILYNTITPFISMWLGNKYVLDYPIVTILIINFFLQSMRSGMLMVQNAAGLVYENRWMPVYEVFINLTLSIIFGLFFSLYGVFYATICSILFLHYFAYPKYVYGMILSENPRLYKKDITKIIMLFVVVLFIDTLVMYLIKKILSGVTIINMVMGGVIGLIVPSVAIYIYYRNTKEYRYFVEFIVRLIKK